MAKVVLFLAIKKLKQLALAEETNELIGAYRQITDSLTSLRDLQQELTSDAQISQERARDIEDLVYRIEDLVARSSVTHLRFNNILSSRKKARSEITILCTNINSLLSPDVAIVNPENSSNSSSWDKYKHDGEPFGMKKETDKILKFLLEVSNHSFQAIPIWGLNGTGKKTLADAICRDPRIVEKFGEHPIKISLSENSNNLKSALAVCLKALKCANEDYGHLPTDVLTQLIRQHLEKSKSLFFLIVLEDVRSIEDWRRLTLAVGDKRSRILVTTISREVAEYINQEPYIHKKMHLTEEESWELLKAVWSKKGVEIPPDRETRVRDMVKLCEGIPKAIITLAREWEIAHRNARPFISQVMAPSYDDLSDQSKLCFLYLANFREDPEIEPEKLSHLWTIEGFISSRECGSAMTLLDLTHEILMVLAQKGMIYLKETVSLRYCRLVGLIGDMCLSKAEEIDLLKVIDFRSKDIPSLLSFTRTRRLVIYLGKNEAQVNIQYRNIRSLRIIKTDELQQSELVLPFIMQNIKKFEDLRILDFDRIDFVVKKLPEGIFALRHLSYLSFRGCLLRELPSSICNLSYLQVLDLRINDLCRIIIPNVLWKMGRLQHLYLPQTFQVKNGKDLQLYGLVELQTLKNFSSKMCQIRDLYKLTKLRVLDAKVEESLENLKSITKYMESPKRSLRSSIDIRNFDCYTEKRHEVIRHLLESGTPPKLSFEGYIDQLPPYHRISQNFTEIVLSSTQLEEDPMPTLEKLPKLRLLVLRDDAFLGIKMISSTLGFPELKQLDISSLFSLEEWRLEKKAMTVLSNLRIENCEKLVLRDDLEFPASLQEINIKKTSEEFKEGLRVRYGKQGVDKMDYKPVKFED